MNVKCKGQLVQAREEELRLGCIPLNHIIYEAPANMSKPMVFIIIFYINKAIDALKEITALWERQVNSKYNFNLLLYDFYSNRKPNRMG